MGNLLVPFNTYLGSGGVITFRGTRAYQAVFWSLQSYNPDTGVYGAALGSLKYSKTKTDGCYCSVNVYHAPEADPGDNSYDVVTVKWSD